MKKKSKHTTYSTSLKLQVIEKYLSGQYSYSVLAEEELKIDIRKKPGTKPSK